MKSIVPAFATAISAALATTSVDALFPTRSTTGVYRTTNGSYIVSDQLVTLLTAETKPRWSRSSSTAVVQRVLGAIEADLVLLWSADGGTFVSRISADSGDDLWVSTVDGTVSFDGDIHLWIESDCPPILQRLDLRTGSIDAVPEIRSIFRMSFEKHGRGAFVGTKPNELTYVDSSTGQTKARYQHSTVIESLIGGRGHAALADEQGDVTVIDTEARPKLLLAGYGVASGRFEFFGTGLAVLGHGAVRFVDLSTPGRDWTLHLGDEFEFLTADTSTLSVYSGGCYNHRAACKEVHLDEQGAILGP